ncbi:uncharacterized protein ELE39_002931 [Cryptosporidium sp. chipmunk genotype I]|uniref:uncharacterized protein n=1 Tax=Cryptosporidium sp. chipmunk genotype I TaxID=1280935 RepID=UPI00351A93FC|nr:hypothetical protein ELE39_002931 [Cryptosporidium sp. chipmunk genotype I]
MSCLNHTEVCIFSPKASILYLKLLKTALKPSIFILDLDGEDYSDDFKNYFLDLYLDRLNIDKQGESEISLTRNVKNSMIPSFFKIFYLIYKRNDPHDFFACNPASKIISLNTGVSTLIRNVCKRMHLVFILDLGSLLWFSELYDDMEQLGVCIDEFLLSLESILNGVSRLLEYLEYVQESVEVRFSVFLFGENQEKCCFKLVFYEIPVISWISETQLFIENLKSEIQQILKARIEFKEGMTSLPRSLWSFEILGLLNSFSVSFNHSLIVITTGVISSRLFSEGNSSSLVCQNNYLLHYCCSNDIQVHFLVINKFNMDLEESEIGLNPSLDTFEFFATSCNSTLTVCDSGINEKVAKKIAMDLLLRSDIYNIPLDIESEVKGQFNCLKEIYSYKVSQKLSVIEILVNKLRNGFNFVKESKIEVPLILYSKFHKLIDMICLIENYKNIQDNHCSEFWSIKFYIKNSGNVIFTSDTFSLLKKLLESKEEIKKPKSFNKPYRLAYILYSFILKNRQLDTWMENLVENYSKTGDIPAFPSGLNSLFLPCIIHHKIDLVLESDQTLLMEEVFDGFKGSWVLLQAKLAEMGFKTFILENQQVEYDFPIKEMDKILIYYNLFPKMNTNEIAVKCDDLGILRILRSWAKADSLCQDLHSKKPEKANEFMAIWLKAQRIIIKVPDDDKSKSEERESQSSLVKFNILYYGFSPVYCQEYTKWFKEKISKYGIDSDEEDLSLLRFSLGTNNLFEGVIDGARCLEKSWSYVLWSEKESYSQQEQEPMDLNGRVILTISSSRYLDGWTLLNRRNDNYQLNSTWYKVRDFQIKDSFKLKLVFIYDLKFQFGNNRNSSKLTCRTLMASSIGKTDIISENHGVCFSFDKFAEKIHFQDNKIIQTISLIDYLYTSSHLRKNIEYLRNVNDEEVNEKSKGENTSEIKSKGFHQNLYKSKFGAINSRYYNIIFSGLTNSKEFNKYKRIIQNKSFYGNDDKISLSIREISNLFLTFNNNEIETDSDDKDILKLVLPFITGYDNYKDTEQELDKEFINKFRPLCLIEIPLINAENLSTCQLNSNCRWKNSDIEARRKYLEGASESSFEKFLYKMSKITDRSVRVDEGEWYTILFIDENDLDCKSGDQEDLMINEDLEPISCDQQEQTNSGHFIRKLYNNQIYDYMIITHIRLHRSSSNVPTSSVLGVYLCSYYNISFGITGKKINIELGIDEKMKLYKVRQFVELYILRVKEIWDSIKFKMISQYYLLGIPICSKDIARIQNENEFNEEKTQPSSRIDSESFSTTKLKRNLIGDPISVRGIDLDLDPEFDFIKEENTHQENFQSLLFGLSSDQDHLSEKGTHSDPDTCSDIAFDIHEHSEVRREVCKYLKCNIFRFKLSLSGFKIVLSRKFTKNVELDKGLDELDKLANFIGEELESRMKNTLRVKLVHFDCQDLNCFLVFCGVLDLYKGSTKNILVTVSLMRNGQNLGISYLELTRFWTRFKKNTEFNPSWFHCLVWKSLTERDDLELKVTVFTSIDKKYIRVNKIDTELWSIIKLEKEVFVSKLRSILSSWMTDMTMELSFIHGNEIWGKSRDESYKMSLFACFGRELLLECLQGVREKVWSDGDELFPTESFEKSEFVSSGSLIFRRDIQFPLIKSTTKFGNDIAVINLLSSQADYIPIKRKPHLVLIWHGSQFPMENLSIGNPSLKGRLRRGILEKLIEHTRVLAEISNPDRLVNNELVLGLALKIYFPSSITTGMSITTQNKYKCRICDFSIERGCLRESINFLFSTMQSRFIDIWKEATCDFLLQNVTISRMVSYLMVPKFISSDYSSLRLEGDKRKPEISILDSNEQEEIFGQISITSEWLYEVPFEVSPAKFRRMKKNSFTSLLKRKLDPDYYEKPGEVILWDGRIIKVPNYIFWLKKHEEVFIEIPSGLYDAPLIDILFGGGNWDISNIDKYNKKLSSIEKSLFGNSDLGKEINQSSEIRSSPKEIEFISLIYPKGWLLYSEDATTSTNTLGTGSIFLIKPDYLFIDIKNKELRVQRKRRKDLISQNESCQSYSVELSLPNSNLNSTKPKSKIGISLSFFGKRKPSKSTKLYFYRQLKFTLQRLISNWNNNLNTIVLSKTEYEKQVGEIFWNSKNELSYDTNQKLETPYHLTLILKLSKAYQNFVGASIWNMVQQNNVMLKCGDLFTILANILTYYNIKYEEIDRGIRIFIRNIDIDSKSEELDYQIDISLYSGINGRILDISDPWAAGNKLGQDPSLNLEKYINDCLLPVFEDEIYQSPSPYWDFNTVLEFIFLYRNNQVDNLNSGTVNETISWNLIRDSNGRLIQIQMNLPIHIIPENNSKETKTQKSSRLFIPTNCQYESGNIELPIYLMPCIYLGADIFYKGKLVYLDERLEINDEANHKTNGIILFINSLLNLVFMELLIKLKLTTKDNWVLKDNFRLSNEEFGIETDSGSDDYSFVISNYYLKAHGVTIRDIHKYRDNIQNFFQAIINNREAIERFIPLKPASKYDTVMENYPVPSLILQDVNGEKDETQMYFPSWSVAEFIKIIRDELVSIQSDKTILSEESNIKTVISGYTCIIHDNKEIDIEERVLKKEDGVSLSNNSSINIKFPIGRSHSFKDTDFGECGWHILKYKSQINYLNSLYNKTDLNINNWVDSLYVMNKTSSNSNIVTGNMNDVEFNNIYGSFFNISGGKERPCITINIHSSNRAVMEYLIILELTPSGIMVVCWNAPILVINKFEKMIKGFIFESCIKMIWSLQLSIWYKYNVIYRKYIFVLDLSKFNIDFNKNLNINYNKSSASVSNNNYYPRICEISTNIISYIWNDRYINKDLKWSHSEDLYKKELIIECKINRLKLEDIIIPNIVLGKILDLKHEDLLKGNEKNEEFNSFIPSVINKIRILNSDDLMERWNNYFFKYKLWVFVNQFLIESFTIKSLRQEISAKVFSKNIILQVSKSNMIFKYQQIINFLKKRVETYNIEYSKYQKVNKTNHQEREDSLLNDENIVQTHYNLLTYLQNSHNIINMLISATVKNKNDHFILIHPNKLNEVFIQNQNSTDNSVTRKELNYKNISSCEFCMINPKDISIRIILSTLFRCSIDVLDRLYNEKKAELDFKDDESSSKEAVSLGFDFDNYKSEENHIQSGKKNSILNRDQEEKFSINKIVIEKLKCFDNKGELLIFIEDISGIPCQNFSSDLGNMYIMKDLTIKLDELFKENGFIRVANSYSEIINKEYLFRSNYCISVISSIFSGVNIYEKIEMKNLSYLMETEIGTEKEIIIYIKTIHIKKYNFSIPICIFLSLYQCKTKIIYLTSIFNDGTSYISQSILEFIEMLNIKKLIFEFVLSYSESLIWNIWSQNNINLKIKNLQYLENGVSDLKLSSDHLIKSIFWLNRFLIDYPNVRKDSNLIMFRIWISKSLKINNNQLVSIQNSFYHYIELEKLSYRIKVLPNSSNTVLILFRSLVRNELIGVILDDFKVDESNSSISNYLDDEKINDKETQNFRNELELPMDCFILKNDSVLIKSDHELNFSKKEEMRLEITNTLSSIQEYIKRDQLIQKIQVYGATCSQRFVDDLANNQFSINLSLNNKLLKQLPVIKIQNLIVNNGIKMITCKSMIKIQENINVIISLFRRFWMENDAIRFSNSLYRIEECGIFGEFLQDRIISVVIKHKRRELILIRFFTTFKVDQGNDMEWIFNEIKFTFKDEDKIKRYFLIKDNDNIGLNYQKNNQVIKEELYELILKSIEFILDNNNNTNK